MTSTTLNSSFIAWVSDLPEDRRFRRILITVMTLCFLFGVGTAIIKLPKPERLKFIPPDQNVVKLIQKKELPKPIKPLELTDEQKEALKKSEEERLKKLEEERKKREEELKKLEDEAKKKLEAEKKKLSDEELKKKQLEDEAKRKQQELEKQKLTELQKEAQRKKAEEDRIRRQQEDTARQAKLEAERQAREEAQRVARKKAEKEAGRKAAQDQFGDLADALGTQAPSAAAVAASKAPLTKGDQAAATTAGGPRVPSKTITSAATESAGRGSGGIDTSKLSSAVATSGGGTLASRSTTQVEEIDLGVKDGGGGGAGAGGGGDGGRTERELNEIMERHKGQMQRIFERALRKNPGLGGKLLARITIQSDGSVSDVDLSGEVDDPTFISQLRTLIKGINFGAKSVGTVVAKYPIDFAA